MFNTPIRHTPLTTLEEVLKFSYRTDRRAEPLTRCQNNGQIAYANENGIVFVTPYRSEINKILSENGYREGSIFVPFSNGEDCPNEYRWLEQIAEEENNAKTHEDAFKVSEEKGIKPVRLAQKLQIKEISYYDDVATHTCYSALTTTFLFNNSIENIGTYIIVDEKTLVICDEYGRTFLVKTKSIINDIVNALIDAGYVRTAHPEYYVQEYKVQSED